MPIEEIREENQTQLDVDTVDQQTRSDSRSSNQHTTEDEKQSQEDPPLSDTEETGVKVYEDIRYDKYFKMKQFGVPAAAVKLKMSAEGLDPSLLE